MPAFVFIVCRVCCISMLNLKTQRIIQILQDNKFAIVIGKTKYMQKEYKIQLITQIEIDIISNIHLGLTFNSRYPQFKTYI